jgi:hypothetical protein
MKTAFAIAITVLGLAQLFAGEERGQPARAPAPHLPAVSSYPKVELPPKTIAAEQRLEAALKTESPNDRELEADAAKIWAGRPRPAEDRREQPNERREAARPQQVETTQQRPTFAEARQRMSLERHDRGWWEQRYNRIVRAGSGYYFFDAGYWYPAFGYDPQFDLYPYDGPIYAVGDMSPDQETAAIQMKLAQAGYYSDSITGVLDSTTQAAIARFQTDHDLFATGAIDEPTAEALGLG